jgi:ABC-2 type transport system ATP-binding protein
MNETLIRIEALAAVYGRGARQVQALRDVALDIHHGEIFGLLGPNGAGKTTLLSCVEGIHQPAAGGVWIAEVEVARQPQVTRRRLGIQLQQTALLDDLTVAELVEVYAALYEVFLTPSQVTDLLARFDLPDQAKVLARRLSGGQKQRLALALAVANNPEIILLDEPTSALDPRARRDVWAIIRALHQEGRTIVITTHAMEEAEALCGRVAIIDGGQIVACDTPARLIAGLGAYPVLKTGFNGTLAQVEGLPGVRMARYSGEYLELETAEPQATLAALQALAVALGNPIGDITLRQPNLEDVFLKLTGKALAA